jgi:hypothetical protein
MKESHGFTAERERSFFNEEISRIYCSNRERFCMKNHRRIIIIIIIIIIITLEAKIAVP